MDDKRRDDPDGPIIEKIIRNTKPINIFMTHYIFYESKPLFEALGDRLKIFIINDSLLVKLFFSS